MITRRVAMDGAGGWRMKAFRYAVAAAILLITSAFVGWLAITVPNSAQRFIVDNQYRDATCRVEFPEGYPPERFPLAAGKTYEWLLKSPRAGFVTVRCVGHDWRLESPGHFHFVTGGLAKITLTPRGEMDVTYEGIGGPS